jgi:chromosome segregation ATPase
MGVLTSIKKFFTGVKETLEDVKNYVNGLKNDPELKFVLDSLKDKDIRATIKAVIDFLKSNAKLYQDAMESETIKLNKAKDEAKQHLGRCECLSKELDLRKEELEASKKREEGLHTTIADQNSWMLELTDQIESKEREIIALQKKANEKKKR